MLTSAASSARERHQRLEAGLGERLPRGHALTAEVGLADGHHRAANVAHHRQVTLAGRSARLTTGEM